MSLSTGLSLPLRRISASKPLPPVLRRSLSPASSRAFSTTLQRDASWGFIGLGQMGMSRAVPQTYIYRGFGGIKVRMGLRTRRGLLGCTAIAIALVQI